jgi:23S rRNA (uridine2479-2'-O)-methyltransferase
MEPTRIKIYTENSDFQSIEALRRNRIKRSRSREFFVEGVRPINQAIAGGWQINTLVFSREKRLSAWAEGIIDKSNARRLVELPLELLTKLSQKDESSELIALIGMPEDDLSRIPIRELSLIVVLDRPSSPGNIGAIIRSCDALQADGLVITGHSADLYDPETIRASTGSFFSLPVVRLPSHNKLFGWIERLKERLPGLQLIGTSETGQVKIQDFDFTSPTILLAGNEAHGLSVNYRNRCDALVAVPMYGSASSLNLAAAISIVLYEIDRQRSRADREARFV